MVKTQPIIGQEVAVQTHYSVMFGFEVTKVTPSGQVVVKRTANGHEVRFDKTGYEIGSASLRYRRDRLVTDVDAAREAIRVAKAKEDTAHLINAVRGDAGRYNDKESLQAQIARLTIALEAARIAVEAL